MAPSRRTWFDERGLVVAGETGALRHLDLFGGALHYWRVPAEHWKPCLRSLRALGLTAVESYVPWRVHEPTAGAFSWRGPHDLRRFCDLAGEAGLAVILRVGPAANAELTGFGLPDDVLADPAISARTSHGSLAWLPAPPRAFPIPSYASAKLHERVARWYRALAEQVAPLAAPAGPLVALGVDNEAQLFFRRGAYDLDYHPEAVARWAALHPQWPEPPRAWAPDDAARCLAWVRFKRTLVAAALRRFSLALDDAGFAGLARLHNLALDAQDSAEIAAALSDDSPPGDFFGAARQGPDRNKPALRPPASPAAPGAGAGGEEEALAGSALGATKAGDDPGSGGGPAAAPAATADPRSAPAADPGSGSVADSRSVADLEAALQLEPSASDAVPDATRPVSGPSALVAFDSHGPVSLPALRRAALRSLSSQPLPLVLECGVGDVPWFPPAGALADQHRALALLAAGARGLSLYMAVERERWVGGLLAPDGTPAPDAAWAPALFAALRRLDWPALRRRAPLALVTSSLDDDLAAASCLVDPITPFATSLANLPHPQLAAEPSTTHLWLRAVERALERAGIPYDVHPDSASAETLASYRAVLAPFPRHIPRALLATLRDLAEAKRTIVVLGPTPPTRDEHDAPLELPALRRVGKMRPGSLDDLEGLAADLTQLAGPPPTWLCPDDTCAVSLFERDGQTRALFLTNDGPATTAVLSTTEPARALVDALTSERIPLSGATRIAMPASSIRLFLVES